MIDRGRVPCAVTVAVTVTETETVTVTVAVTVTVTVTVCRVELVRMMMVSDLLRVCL